MGEIYISVCSGIEAASVAFGPLGFEPIAFCEIEKFPCAVLAHHYPGVPNLGDMTKVDWESWRGKAELLVGGTPCQSFSVAGLRKGLEDPRGNLTLWFLRIVDRVRPDYIIWENVSGIVSISGGSVLQSFVDALTQMGYVVDIDILDAQFFGVPQRRRRVFVTCVRIDGLLQKKTPTSDRIAGDLLAQSLLATWDALRAVSYQGKRHSGSGRKTAPTGDILLKKIASLNALLGGSAASRLLDYFDEEPRLSTRGPQKSESDSPQYSGQQSRESKTDTAGFRSSVKANESGSKNTDMSSRKIWEDIWSEASESTTSTLIVSTTEERTCSFVGAMLSILRYTIVSPEYALSRNWSSDSWSLAYYALTLLKEVTKYAGSTDCELRSAEELRACWRDHQLEAERLSSEIERNLGDWATSDEVLSLSEGLRGDSAKGRKKGEGRCRNS